FRILQGVAMRLPVRRIAVVLAAALTAGSALAQNPPPPPPAPQAPPAPPAPQKEIQGGATIVAPSPQTVVRQGSAPPSVEAAPPPLGYESDLHCFGYVGPAQEVFPAQVIGAEAIAEQIDYFTGDLLYVDAGYNRGLKVGDEFWLVTPEQMVTHPKTLKD